MTAYRDKLNAGEFAPPAEGEQQAGGDTLDEMTKNELLAEAERRDLNVSSSLTKDELKEALRAG